MSPLQVAVLKARYARPPEPAPEPMKIQIADPQAERIKRMEEVLRKAAIEHPLQISPTRAVKVIKERVAAKYGVRELDLLSTYRFVRLAWPRQIAMYLAKTKAKMSFPAIARAFGDRHHTTALYAFRKVSSRRAADPNLDAELSAIEATLV